MGEQPLPSWLTDKITVAADDLNGARDYLMNPQTEQVELDELKVKATEYEDNKEAIENLKQLMTSKDNLTNQTECKEDEL